MRCRFVLIAPNSVHEVSSSNRAGCSYTTLSASCLLMGSKKASPRPALLGTEMQPWSNTRAEQNEGTEYGLPSPTVQARPATQESEPTGANEPHVHLHVVVEATSSPTPACRKFCQHHVLTDSETCPQH